VARHDHAVQRLGADLAKPEENPRHRRSHGRRDRRRAQGCLCRFPRQHAAIDPDAHEHGRIRPRRLLHLNADEISQTVRLALAEDIGRGDLTAALTPSGAHSTAVVVLKQDAVICGIEWFEESFRQLDQAVSFEWSCGDGDELSAEFEVCRIEGETRAILTGERTALNFLQTLSATATSARRFVAAIEGTGATLLDTRKTLPGLRSAQKYAVRCGGASNHRIGLFDAILIKENHIVAIGSIDAAIENARAAGGSVLVEIEVETMDQLRRALDSRADRLMLDEFPLDRIREAVELRNETAPDMKLEASGQVILENVRQIALTGVDFISVGAMTKNVEAIDYSLRVVDDF
jgi:nicotinate-nucleotide pyrophosphorylase (carboxylating)